MLSLKKSRDVTFGPSYVLFALAGIVTACILLSLHLRYKPESISWQYYDPTFVYALTETPEALAQESCQSHTVLGFGTSVFDWAIATRNSHWLRWNHWQTFDGSLKEPLRIHSIVRTGKADLRFFDPLLSLLPDCPKVVVLHSAVLFPYELEYEGTGDFLRAYLIDSPRFYYASLIEKYWKKPYQIGFQIPVEQSDPQEYKPFVAADFASGFKHRGNFQEVSPYHRLIIDRLIANHAQVVIVEIDGSEEWEAAGRQPLAHYRNVLKAYADTNSAIHYRESPPQARDYYVDYVHMNRRGAELFRSWLAGTVEIINSDQNGF